MLQPDFSAFPEIITTRLLLRKMTFEDAPEILQLRSTEAVMQYIDRPRAESIADAEVYINKIITSLDNNDGITWAIALRERPAVLIGTIGYWRIIKEHYRAEIGYMLNPDYWRNGIMKEALLAVIDFGFSIMNLHSVEAVINPVNASSAALLLSTGFVQEAYFKENYFFNGVFGDSIIYSRLR